MPWGPKDAKRFTHKADTTAKSHLWSSVANSSLAEHGDEARAIREANAAVARRRGPVTKAALVERKHT